jgi:hypothetical protein
VEPETAEKKEPMPFQEFDALPRRIIKVPKVEVDRRATKAKAQRQRKRRGKK